MRKRLKHFLVRIGNWWYWQKHFARVAIPRQAEAATSMLVCPDCDCSYDLRKLGIRDGHSQATVHCHCGKVLEVTPHEHLGWKSPAAVIRAHIPHEHGPIS